MTFQWIKATLAAAVIAATGVTAQAEGWAPDGPVTMKIGFRAGGGADSMGRLLAQELSETLGWEIIPQNVAGRGGLAIAMDVAQEPADGLTVGISTFDTFAYALQTAGRIGITAEDFTFLSSLTGSQMGLIARTDRGWSTLGDVIAAAKAGENISIGVMNQKLADGTYLIGRENGVEFTTVMIDGGRAGLNGVTAKDLDISWAAGLQAAGVRSGDIINLASAEDQPLTMSPDAPLLSEFNMPFSFGSGFLVFGPADMPDEIAETYATEIGKLLNDPESQLSKMVTKTFAGPMVVQRDDLRAMIQKRSDEASALIDASSE
ncbi:tripartite tricarboxylate transporter substrate-binding protein [Marinovum sp.]|uniref:tripartite tricarboxylate transporter substrate-binding protein n=1 Tax=Marinovum sp. TaxID=2024839 RepID=UPI002B26BE20|nr:tripartite tricarboxylate transporter substrate-binding protein [Marinovum sp.]